MADSALHSPTSSPLETEPLSDRSAKALRDLVAQYYQQTQKVLKTKLVVSDDAAEPSLNELERLLARKATHTVVAQATKLIAQENIDTPTEFPDLVRFY